MILVSTKQTQQIHGNCMFEILPRIIQDSQIERELWKRNYSCLVNFWGHRVREGRGGEKVVAEDVSTVIKDEAGWAS